MMDRLQLFWTAVTYKRKCLTKGLKKFDLKATNGQVIATSQVYKSPVTCKKGIASN